MEGGGVIQRARRWSGLSTTDLAELLGVSAAAVQTWEAGDPEFSIVQRAVAACSVDLSIVVMEPDPDPHDLALLDRSLRLSVDERMERLKNYVRFVEAGRSALQAKQ